MYVSPLISILPGIGTADSDPSSDGSNADSANEIAALRAQLKQKDDTISALRQRIGEINSSKDIGKFSPGLCSNSLLSAVQQGSRSIPLELSNMECVHAVEMEKHHEAVSKVWQHHCEETSTIFERKIARQDIEMSTQKEHYEMRLRTDKESYGVALLKKDWAFQTIAGQYESALAEKDKEVAAAREEAEDAKSALKLMEGNHNNEILDLKEDHEAVVKEMETDLTTTKVKLQKSEKSVKQPTMNNKVLEGKLKAQTALATNLTSQVDETKSRVSELEVELAQTKAIARIFLKKHHERTWRLKLRNSILVSANQTLLAGQEILQRYISDQQCAFLTYYEENKERSGIPYRTWRRIGTNSWTRLPTSWNRRSNASST